MPYIYISAYSGPPSTVTVCDVATSLICYTYPTQISDVDPFPITIPLPSTFDLVGAISLSAQSVNGCLIVQTDVCSVLPTPTATFTLPCYAWLITPTDLWSSGDTLDYTDCYGSTTTYTAQTGDANGFYICAQGIISGQNMTWDDSFPTLECTEIDGEWVLPYIATPTPTSTNPPTPTPSPTSGLTIEESLYFAINIPSGKTLVVSELQPSSTVYINWGDGAVSSYTPSNSSISHTYSTLTSGTLRISGQTTTPGEIQNIYGIKVRLNGVTNAPDNITGYTTEISKIVNAVNIDFNATSSPYITGDISEFSSCNSLDILTIQNGDITGDIATLPNSIRILEFEGYTTTPGNTVYGDIANMPTSINVIQLDQRNTINGDIVGIATHVWPNPSQAILNINGNSTLSGNISNIPNISNVKINIDVTYGGINSGYFSVTATTGNTITGNLTLKTYNKTVKIAGQNTISGTLSATTIPTDLRDLTIYGNNTISGGLSLLKTPKNYFIIAGNNTISGDVASIISIPATIQGFVVCQRSQYTNPSGPSFGWVTSFITSATTGNTITGNINAFATSLSLGYFIIGGNNTLYGDLNSWNLMNQNINSLQIVSTGNTVNGANFSPTENDIFNWNSNGWLNLFTNNTGNGLPSVEVNKLIVYLDNASGGSGGIAETGNVSILGTGHSGPTGTAITTKNTMISQGWTINTN
jgi:hypothetical protein